MTRATFAVAAAGLAATAGVLPVALAHHGRTAAAFTFAATLLAIALYGCAVEARRSAQARRWHHDQWAAWTDHLANTAAGRVDVNARLLAELHDAHETLPDGRGGQVDADATDVRGMFDALGVDLSDPAALNAVMACVHIYDAAGRQSAGRGGGFEMVACWQLDAMVAKNRAVHGVRQVALHAARGDVTRTVDA